MRCLIDSNKQTLIVGQVKLCLELPIRKLKSTAQELTTLNQTDSLYYRLFRCEKICCSYFNAGLSILTAFTFYARRNVHPTAESFYRFVGYFYTHLYSGDWTPAPASA